jgi:hypothetical protein
LAPCGTAVRARRWGGWARAAVELVTDVESLVEVAGAEDPDELDPPQAVRIRAAASTMRTCERT